MSDTPREIRIRMDSEIAAAKALQLVSYVIEGGRVSNGSNGPSYCFGTTFRPQQHGQPGWVVYADRTRTTDTFRVKRDWYTTL